LGDLRLPLNRCVVRGRHGVDVARVRVVDRLDLEGVDGETDFCHFGLGPVQDLGRKLLPFRDDFLDGHRANNGAQVAGKDTARQRRHLILVGEEPLPRVHDAFVVAADLERDDCTHVERDTLLRHTRLSDLGLAHRQGQETNLAEDRQDPRSVAGDNAEWRSGGSPLPTGNEHRLIWCGDSVAEHWSSSARRRRSVST
jgi:hypothetical protein